MTRNYFDTMMPGLLDSASAFGPVSVQLKDGTSVVLRAVQPTDELLLKELLDSCSPESLYQRFHYVTKRTGELASRFCNVEDGHERVIVAEIESEEGKKLIGFGDLAPDPRHGSVEAAVLVADRWQGRGLGGILCDSCLDMAYRWGVKEVCAITTPDNRQVIAMAQKLGFHIQWQLEDRTLGLRKSLCRKSKPIPGEAA
jgi:acetyltransferase